MRRLLVWLAAAAATLAAALPAAAADRTRAVDVLAPGQGGNRTALTPGPPHAADQVAAWLAWRYKPMAIDDATAGAPVSPVPGVTVRRDASGVPVVRGATLALVQVGAGYALAQDRLYQMDVYRHIARGTAAELLGREWLETDRTTRREGLSGADLARLGKRLPKLYRDLLGEFARGVNLVIAQTRADPGAWRPLDYPASAVIEPWSVADSLAIAAWYARRQAGGGRELASAELLRALRVRNGKAAGERYWQDAVVRSDPAAPTAIPAAQGAFAPLGAGRSGGGPAAPGVVLPDSRPAFLPTTAPAPAPAAGTVLISPLRAEGSAPILAGGTAEEPLAEIALIGGGLESRGATLPGIGGFALSGHSATHAWTIASGGSDQVDTFAVEVCGGSDRRYRYRGACRPMEVRTETFRVRGATGLGGAGTMVVLRTVHGPVIGYGRAGKQRVAFARAVSFAGRETDAVPAYFSLNTNLALSGFLGAAAQVPYSANLSYAGSDGHIAYVHAGRYPIRARGTDDRLPTDGSGGYDWEGVQPAGRRPVVVDPATGTLASWNGKPAAAWIGGDSAPWGGVQRVTALEQGLAADPSISFEDATALLRAAAVTDPRVTAFRPALLAALAGTSEPALVSAREALAAWDGRRLDANGDGRYDAPGVAIFDEWWLAAQRRLLTPVYRGQLALLGPDADRAFGGADRAGLLLRVIQGRAARLRPTGKWPAPAGVQRALALAFGDAAAALRNRYRSSSPAVWLEPVPELGSGAQGAPGQPALPFANRGRFEQVVELTR